MAEPTHNILKRIRSTPFPEGFAGIADDAAAHIDAQDAKIKALRILTQ